MSEEQREKENRRAVKISVSLPAEVLEAARRAAADDSRTVSGYFQRLVVADLAADMKGGRP